MMKYLDKLEVLSTVAYGDNPAELKTVTVYRITDKDLEAQLDVTGDNLRRQANDLLLSLLECGECDSSTWRHREIARLDTDIVIIKETKPAPREEAHHE